VTSTVLVLLGLVGVTIIVTRGDIFARWRNLFAWWKSFWSCPLCVGFWIGVGHYALGHSTTITVSNIVDHVIWGGLVGLLSLMVAAWLISHLGEPERS
jgi:hypothetical protein